MSEAKEGKLFGRKKLLDPLLGTTEGTKITSTIIFYTSHALTVYSNEKSTDPSIFSAIEKDSPLLRRSSDNLRTLWKGS